MDYIGSKKSLNEWIFNIIKSTTNKQTSQLRLIDGCAGSGSTSLYACKEGFYVIANDLLKFTSYVIKGQTISNIFLPECYSHIDTLNLLDGVEGFFYQNYSQDAGRLYFKNENAKKIDACRAYIETIENESIKAYLLWNLLEAMNYNQNCTGVQVSFLKELKLPARYDLKIKKGQTFEYENIEVHNLNVFDLIQQVDADILYLDPPYNKRQYGSNYHLNETLVKYDNPVIAKGITGYRDWKSESKSEFCSRLTFLEFLQNIISLTSATKIFISYNSDAIISKEKIMEMVNSLGYSIECFEKEYIRYKSDNSRKNKTNSLFEYLFYVSK